MEPRHPWQTLQRIVERQRIERNERHGRQLEAETDREAERSAVLALPGGDDGAGLAFETILRRRVERALLQEFVRAIEQEEAAAVGLEIETAQAIAERAAQAAAELDQRLGARDAVRRVVNDRIVRERAQHVLERAREIDRAVVDPPHPAVHRGAGPRHGGSGLALERLAVALARDMQCQVRCVVAVGAGQENRDAEPGKCVPRRTRNEVLVHLSPPQRFVRQG